MNAGTFVSITPLLVLAVAAFIALVKELNK
jgi:hypothetical protein